MPGLKPLGVDQLLQAPLVTEWVKGKSIEEAMIISNSDIAEELSLPPVKIHCSILAQDAIAAAIKDYKEKRALKSNNDDWKILHPVCRKIRAESKLQTIKFRSWYIFMQKVFV